ncbi:MAG: Hsp70 family protein [Clostridiales bacterium]|nr:Hsp70 family protein [Clostridiales bacterium]
MRYIGFDMGDGESAVAIFEQGSGIEPVILPIAGARSLLSAVGTVGGEIVVGERAYTDALADGLSVRFKSRFTYDPASYEDIVRFARGVLRELTDAGSIQPGDRFVVGCPAGWNTACRARYRNLLMRAGIHEPQVISESRAAFLYAKYARTIALDVDILNQSALVIDIGSSTLDFAYIVDGRETGVGTFGDVMLGGGFLDEEFLRRAVEKNRDRDDIKQVFAECKSWYSFCEIEARRVKEEFFTRLAIDPKAKVKKQLRICYDGVQKLMLELDSEEANHLIYDPLSTLNGQSFASAVENALTGAARVTADKPPKLVLLTGGASRMPFFRDLCRETFSDAVVVCCPDPEFSIAKGLAYAGWIDENLREFRKAIEEEVTDAKVSEIANDALPSLIPSVVNSLIDLILEEAAIPITNQWKDGQIDTLDEMNARMQSRMERVLNSPLAEEALAPAVKQWLSDLTGDLQQLVDPICDRYDVPRKEMQLNLTTDSSSNVSINTSDLMGLPFLGTMMGMIVSIIVGLLCGGSGIALISTGPLGFVAGLFIGAVISLFGWTAMSKAIMKAKIPPLMRRANLEKKLRSNATRQSLQTALKEELSGTDSAFQTQIVSGFSKSFRNYLYGIAQAAEIPIE